MRHKINYEKREEILDKVQVFKEEKQLYNIFDVAWKMLVDFPGRDCAFTPVLGTSCDIGIADINIQGYTPTAICTSNKAMSYPEWEQVADFLNKEVLNIDEREAARIVSSSMFTAARIRT